MKALAVAARYKISVLTHYQGEIYKKKMVHINEYFCSLFDMIFASCSS